MAPRDLAAKYRKENPDVPAGGYVVIYHGKVAGWTDSVAEPRGWLAGCIAVPENAQEPMHLAIGGNSMHGAEKWEPQPDL